VVDNNANSSTVATKVSKIDLFFVAVAVPGTLDNPQVGTPTAGVANANESTRATSSTPYMKDGVAWSEAASAAETYPPAMDAPVYTLNTVGDTIAASATGEYHGNGVINATGTFYVGARVTLIRADSGAEVQCVATTDSIVLT
jgi:hypothetical protein